MFFLFFIFVMLSYLLFYLMHPSILFSLPYIYIYKMISVSFIDSIHAMEFSRQGFFLPQCEISLDPNLPPRPMPTEPGSMGPGPSQGPGPASMSLQDNMTMEIPDEPCWGLSRLTFTYVWVNLFYTHVVPNTDSCRRPPLQSCQDSDTSPAEAMIDQSISCTR